MQASDEAASDEVQYFVGKAIRRGTATWNEVLRVRDGHGDWAADVLTKELCEAGVQVIGDWDAGLTPQTNVLMNDLTLVELVSLCLQLPVVAKTPRRLHRRVLSHRSYELGLKRLDYLDSDYEWYYLSPAFNSLQRSIRRLFDSGEIPFARNWAEGDKRTNLKYLHGLITHPSFVARIIPKIRQHYLDLREVHLLVNWIEATGESMPTMVDIIRAGLERDGADMVRRLLLSDQPSTAESALEGRKDVCFSCPPQRRCRPLQGIADPYGILTDYRSATFGELIASRYPGRHLDDCLMEDGLVAKFFLPYSIVVSAKEWMRQVFIIDNEVLVLDKSHGQYCPRNDVWALEPLKENSSKWLV
jgi:hypothetical protein